MPLRLAGLARSLAGRWREVSLMDVLTGLAEALPPGLYTGAGIENYIREVFYESDRTDDFRLLETELYLIATDLDTCERVVFGVAGLGRRADLEGGLGIDGAADGLPAGRGRGPPVHRRRHPLDDQRRHRGRAWARSSSSWSTRSSPT